MPGWQSSLTYLFEKIEIAHPRKALILLTEAFVLLLELIQANNLLPQALVLL